MSTIELHHLTKTFPPHPPTLQSITLTIPTGSRLALLGPSGSGKSTLLRLIAGLETPDAGEIVINGELVTRRPPHKRGVAFLPQRVALYPHLTVEQNLAVTKSKRIAESLELLQLQSLKARYPHQLSGGERQRVGLAKLLVAEAPIWLLDEPFSGLDPVFRSEFRSVLHLLLTRSSATILLVTHDPTDAFALGGRVGVLGNGVLQQIGTAEELQARPANRFIAASLGRFGFLDGVLRGGEHSQATFVSECGSIAISLPQAIARQVSPSAPNLTLGIRPEDVVVVSPTQPCDPNRVAVSLNGWPLVFAEPVGSGWWLTVARESSRLRVNWPSDSPPPVGAQLNLLSYSDRWTWFDGTGRRLEPLAASRDAAGSGREAASG